MGKITLILGGGRSGKSQFAINLARSNKKVAFIATGIAFDAEMKKRIVLHKKNRPKNWKIFEEPYRVALLLKKITNKFDVILLECLTLLVSNLLLKNFDQEAIEEEIKKILLILKKSKNQSIIVSNEVGLGIVPKNKLARSFRDIAGKVNQMVAEKCDEVFFMVSGIPWRIK